ncbi:MAG: metallophosphoesterase family protein [Longibaculum sp.]
MRDIDFINTFFNIVYLNEPAYMRDLTSSYEYMKQFYLWLENRNIDCDVLSHITPDDFVMLSERMTANDVDHILHVPFSMEMIRLSVQFKDATHILYVPGFDEETIMDIPYTKYENIYFYAIHDVFHRSDLSFFDPFPAFFCAMNHADLWPGVLIFNQNQRVFTSLSSKKELESLKQHIFNKDNLFEVYNQYHEDSYFLQLSDLHLGQNKRQKALSQLYNSLDFIVPLLRSDFQLKVLITGDLMESPNRRNMYMANDFMNNLKKRYKANVTFILGNHDVIVHGFNMARNQKSKVIAYLLGENIKVLEKEKIILIKIDTTSEGNLARGKVGLRQLMEIDDELEAIDHLEDYMIVAMLHHHVYPISKAQFIKTKWHEKTFINRIVETSKVLVDAPMLIEWLKKRNIHYIFHGHKHLPFFRVEDEQYYIGGGSSTGGLKESQSRYISYNVVKYNIHDKKMKTCMIFYDDKAKAERQRVEVYLFREEDNENSR